MPEIWLNYGPVEVNVDIRAENLGRVIEPPHATLDDASLLTKLKGLGVRGRAAILVAGDDKPLLTALSALLQACEQSGIDPQSVSVLAAPRHIQAVRRACEGRPYRAALVGKPEEEVGVVDGVTLRVPKALMDAESRVLLSRAGFDPLFGFDGGPASLLRMLGEELVGEAFTRSPSPHPEPGGETKAAEFAERVADQMGEFSSVEVLAWAGGLADVYIGSMKDAHRNACAKLMDSASFSFDEGFRSIIASPGGEAEGSTLAGALKSLWNVVGGLRRGGVVALFAECARGLGSEALTKYVTGGLDIDAAVRHRTYVEGLESLRYLRESLEHLNVILVSTLPNYYAGMKLGLQVASRVGEALTYIYSTQGSRTKVQVVPRASETLIAVRK